MVSTRRERRATQRGCPGWTPARYARARVLIELSHWDCPGVTCPALRATPFRMVRMAIPITKLMTAVAIMLACLTSRLSGSAVATTVSSNMIQVKNRPKPGVLAASNCSSAVAASAQAPADRAYVAVFALPHSPSPLGASTATSNKPRAIRIPATAIRPATTAVASPPAHSRPVSSRPPDGVGSALTEADFPLWTHAAPRALAAPAVRATTDRSSALPEDLPGSRLRPPGIRDCDPHRRQMTQPDVPVSSPHPQRVTYRADAENRQWNRLGTPGVARVIILGG